MKLSWKQTGIQQNQSASSQRRRDGCTECRRKKVKCDLQKPTCSRCLRYPRGCQYESNFIIEKTQKISKTSANKPKSPKQTVSLQAPLNPWANLSSREIQFFMHHFGTQTACVLFPLAPPIFGQRLVSTALDTSHLMHAFLASACSHHARLIGDTSATTASTILKYTNLAINGLRDALLDETKMLKPETAMTAMALCTNDVCNGNPRIWRLHLSGVQRLLGALFEKPGSENDEFVICLLKWFATLDISAGLSGIHAGCVQDGRYWSLGETGYIDDICGYSMGLLPILARIGRLARQRAHATLPLDSEANEIENQLLSLSNRGPSEFTLSSHGDLAIESYSTHKAFIHSAFLHLYRRVQLLPKDHPKVRSQILEIINATNQIRPFSPANILILWPIFSAGCETDDIIERDIIQSRMANMQATGMGNFTRAREALEMYWESGSLSRWDLYFAENGLELVLF